MPKPKVIKLLNERRIDYRLLKLPERAYTVNDVVRLAGVKTQEICKTILLIGKKSKRPVIVIVPGDKRVNIASVELIVNEKLRLARKDEIKQITGYELGALPPYGHKKKIRTIVDKLLIMQPKINFSAGIHNLGVEINSRDFSRVVDFEIGDISI
jgi:Cys-tRNA(Pro) deacylase